VSERPILIVGCPRSGTTLVRDLLRSHPRVTFPLESRWIPALYRAHGDPVDATAARRAARDLLGTWEISTWGLGLTPRELEHHRSFAGLVSQLYETWAVREGKPRWGDKTPLYILELEVMLHLFPDAQVINLVRDGRDVALSLLAQPWGPSNVRTAAMMWRRAMRAGRRASGWVPHGQFLEVRYESLLAAPERELRGVCAFLEEPFDPAVLTASRLPTPSGSPNPWPVHRETAVDHSNSGRWRTAMSPAETRRFEAVAGEELGLAGYPLSSRARSAPPVAPALWRARDLIKWTRWRSTTWDRGPRARTTAILVSGRMRAAARRRRPARP
jgi:hypothetical protein